MQTNARCVMQCKGEQITVTYSHKTTKKTHQRHVMLAQNMDNVTDMVGHAMIS